MHNEWHLYGEREREEEQGIRGIVADNVNIWTWPLEDGVAMHAISQPLALSNCA